MSDNHNSNIPKNNILPITKRLFAKLLFFTCCFISIILFMLWLIPYIGLAAIHPRLPLISGIFFVFLGLILLWLGLTLIYHLYSKRPLPGLHFVRFVTIRFFFPLIQVMAKIFFIKKDDISSSFILINNEMVLGIKKKAAPAKILILLPHCLQNSVCPHRVSASLDSCTRCGKCPITNIIDLKDKYGFILAIATGGTIARKIVVSTRPELIIAVACERDLVSGIIDSYPLPVFGVLNIRDNGPCIDTNVDCSKLEKAIQQFI